MVYFNAADAKQLAFNVKEKEDGFEEVLDIIRESAGEGILKIIAPLHSSLHDKIERNKKDLEFLGFYVPQNSWEIRIEV